MDPQCFSSRSEAKTVSRQITRLISISCHVSFVTLILSIHHLGESSLHLSPYAFILTLLHHGLILYDRGKSNVTAPDSSASSKSTSPLSPQPNRIPLSAGVPVIFIGSLAGIIWLAASTVASSTLGISLWAHPKRRLEHTFLVAEVVLSLVEIDLLVVLVALCLRERALIQQPSEERDSMV